MGADGLVFQYVLIIGLMSAMTTLVGLTVCVPCCIRKRTDRGCCRLCDRFRKHQAPPSDEMMPELPKLPRMDAVTIQRSAGRGNHALQQESSPSPVVGMGACRHTAPVHPDSVQQMQLDLHEATQAARQAERRAAEIERRNQALLDELAHEDSRTTPSGTRVTQRERGEAPQEAGSSLGAAVASLSPAALEGSCDTTKEVADMLRSSKDLLETINTDKVATEREVLLLERQLDELRVAQQKSLDELSSFKAMDAELEVAMNTVKQQRKLFTSLTDTVHACTEAFLASGIDDELLMPGVPLQTAATLAAGTGDHPAPLHHIPALSISTYEDASLTATPPSSVRLLEPVPHPRTAGKRRAEHVRKRTQGSPQLCSGKPQRQMHHQSAPMHGRPRGRLKKTSHEALRPSASGRRLPRLAVLSSPHKLSSEEVPPMSDERRPPRGKATPAERPPPTRGRRRSKHVEARALAYLDESDVAPASMQAMEYADIQQASPTPAKEPPAEPPPRFEVLFSGEARVSVYSYNDIMLRKEGPYGVALDAFTINEHRTYLQIDGYPADGIWQLSERPEWRLFMYGSSAHFNLLHLGQNSAHDSPAERFPELATSDIYRLAEGEALRRITIFRETGSGSAAIRQTLPVEAVVRSQAKPDCGSIALAASPADAAACASPGPAGATGLASCSPGPHTISKSPPGVARDATQGCSTVHAPRGDGSSPAPVLEDSLSC